MIGSGDWSLRGEWHDVPWLRIRWTGMREVAITRWSLVAAVVGRGTSAAAAVFRYAANDIREERGSCRLPAPALSPP